MKEASDALAKVTAEANEIFGKMGAAVEEQVKGGATELDVAAIAERAGLELDRGTLAELQVDPTVYVLSWLDWYHFFPIQPLWCWWWHRYYPYYRCCRYWWHSCHPYHIW